MPHTQENQQSPSKVSINLLWVNKTLALDQEHILPAAGCGRGTTQVSCMTEVYAWKKANPEAEVTLWYDSVYTTPNAIQNSKIELKSMAEDVILLKDIRDIPIVKNNPIVFSNHIPIYFRIDLLKFIILVYAIENEHMDCALIADFLTGYLNPLHKKQSDQKLGKQELFSPEILPKLMNYGLIVGRESDAKLENQFLYITKHSKVLNAFKFIINICLNTAVTSLNLVRSDIANTHNSTLRVASLSDFIYEILFKPTALILCLRDIEPMIERLQLNDNGNNYNQFGNTIYGHRVGTVVFSDSQPIITLPTINLQAMRDDHDLFEIFGCKLNTNKMGMAHNCRYEDLEPCPIEGAKYTCTFMQIPITSKPAILNSVSTASTTPATKTPPVCTSTSSVAPNSKTANNVSDTANTTKHSYR